MGKPRKKKPDDATAGDNDIPVQPAVENVVTNLNGERLNDPDKQLEPMDPEQEARVVFIIELYGMAYTKRAVILAFRKKYGLSLEQTYRYIRIAEWRIKEESEGTAKEKVQQAINRVKTTVRQAKASGDYRAAHLAEKYLDQLMGIQEAESRPAFPAPNNGGENDGQRAGEELTDETFRALAQLIEGEAAKNGGLQPASVDPQ